MLFKSLIESLLPPGSLWTAESGGDLDLLFDGIADCKLDSYEFLKRLAHIRDPQLTPMLDDLETEFGQMKNNNLTETVRRNTLQTLMTSRNGTGRVEYLQRKLQQAGFLVNVYNNDPPVDPAGIVSYDPGTMCSESDDLFGESGEYFIAQGGELLANGPVYSGTALVEYEIPTDPVYWPFIFFIGGEVTRNGDGEIIGMTTAQVPFSRKQEFIRMIIRYKPLHTWVGVVVEYI